MQQFTFYAVVLGEDGDCHTSAYPHAIRIADTAMDACQQIVNDYKSDWPNIAIGPTGRVVTLNPQHKTGPIMSLVIGKHWADK